MIDEASQITLMHAVLGMLSSDCYAILVDEAQFFAPTWFAAIKATPKSSSHLLPIAGPTQGFLGGGRSWLDAGIDTLFDSERDLQLDEADNPELIRRNTRKIYTALTHAMRECVVCFRHETTRVLLRGEN